MTHTPDELRRLAAAATPGPWSVNDLRNATDGNRECLWVDADYRTTYGRMISTVAELTEEGGLQVIWKLDDARFIAAARTAIPELLDALEAARKDAAELRRDVTHAVSEAKRREPDYPWERDTASEAVWVLGSSLEGTDLANQDCHAEIARLHSIIADLRRQLAGLGIHTGDG
jgi:hypothetical protein